MHVSVPRSSIKWKQTQGPSGDKWINKMWYIHIMDIICLFKKMKYLYMLKQKNFENIVLRKSLLWKKPFREYLNTWSHLCVMFRMSKLETAHSGHQERWRLGRHRRWVQGLPDFLLGDESALKLDMFMVHNCEDSKTTESPNKLYSMWIMSLWSL